MTIAPAALAAALNGIAVLQASFRLFTGARHGTSVPLKIGMRERLAVVSSAALVLGGGLYPQPGVTSRHRAAVAILSRREITAPTSDSQRASRAAVSGSAELSGDQLRIIAFPPAAVGE